MSSWYGTCYAQGQLYLYLFTDSAKKKLAQCKQKWLEHVHRMEDMSYPKQLFEY